MFGTCPVAKPGFENRRLRDAPFRARIPRILMPGFDCEWDMSLTRASTDFRTRLRINGDELSFKSISGNRLLPSRRKSTLCREYFCLSKILYISLIMNTRGTITMKYAVTWKYHHEFLYYSIRIFLILLLSIIKLIEFTLLLITKEN